jgi:hypothetical protein
MHQNEDAKVAFTGNVVKENLDADDGLQFVASRNVTVVSNEYAVANFCPW